MNIQPIFLPKKNFQGDEQSSSRKRNSRQYIESYKADFLSDLVTFIPDI